ncbi:MAG: hypothetical protein HOA17_08015 [Candidatus Melainabacteria bacterium]|nr:hypothetical protein [Candidatus Melainabacteria bacterium]
MRKSILLAMLLLLSVSSANAALAPLNVQQAAINTENPDQLTIGFDWFHDHGSSAGSETSSDGFNLLRMDWRHSLDTGIPTRIGMSAGLSYGTTDSTTGDSSAFGFSNIGLSLEAALVDEEDFALTWYINQHFPMVQSSLLLNNTLRPVSGRNAYGFQTGAEYTISLGDNLAWHGDVGYRFDVPDAGATQHSLIYYNEAVWSGEDFGLSLGLLGNTVYTDNLGTDLRLVPGIIIPMDDMQFRAGLPLGINNDSPDIGVQASIYKTF